MADTRRAVPHNRIAWAESRLEEVAQELEAEALSELITADQLLSLHRRIRRMELVLEQAREVTMARYQAVCRREQMDGPC